MIPERSRDYDPTLFQSTAYYYARYRDWPEELFAALEEALSLDGRGRLLDLGCGTGQLAIPLAPKFEEVVGVDPDPEMLGEARRLAAEAGATNIRWVQARAEDVSSTLGTFRLVTIGSAFHWMDRERVLATLYDIVAEDGALAVIDGHGLHDPHPWPVIKRVLRRYLGDARRAGEEVYQRPEGRYEDTIRGSGFRLGDTLVVPFEKSLNLDEMIGLVFSMSFASRRLLGDQAETFEGDLRRALHDLDPAGQFSQREDVHAILARKT